MLTRPVSPSALRHLTLLSLAVLVAAACAPSEAPERVDSGVAPATTPAVGSAVRVVYLDPDTGGLRSTPPEGVAPVEDASLAERGVGDFQRGLEVIRHDDGMLEFTRPEGFRVKLVATLDDDGNLTMRHTTDASPNSDVEDEEVTHER